MAINKGIIAKKINGEVEQIYPKTSADMVICEDNESVEAKLQSIETTNEQLSSQISSFQGGMKYVDSLASMTDTSRAYVYNGEWYYYDSTTESWKSGGEVAGIETDSTLTISGAAADAAVVGNKLFKINIVSQLPATGAANTFYLISKGANKGYDKYWWVTDNGVSKWDIFGGSSTEVVSSLPNNGDEDIDYILVANNGCFYYKWINNDWRVIGGSMATVVDDIDNLPQTGNELTDYYVAQSNGSYQHYRWKDAEDENDEPGYHIVGGDSYTKSEVDTLLATINSNIADNASDIADNAASISTLNTTVSGLQASLSTANTDIAEIQQTLDDVDNQVYKYNVTYGTAVIEGEEKENVFRLYQYKGDDFDEEDEENIIQQFIIQGGSGGASATNLNVQKITSSPVTVIPSDNIVIEYTYSSTDGDGDPVDGTYTWKLGNAQIANGTLVQGRNTFDATNYISTAGTYNLTLTVRDSGGGMTSKTWKVVKIDMRVESNFSDSTIYNINRDINFNYMPYGAIEKTVHIKLDGEEIATETLSVSGIEQIYTIDADEYGVHGAHLIECYMTATINGTNVETDHIYKNIIWSDEGNEEAAPIVACSYRYDLYGELSALQYNTTSIPFFIYDPAYERPTVVLKEDNVVVDEKQVETNSNVWNYTSSTIGEHTLEISCRGTSVTIVVDIEDIGIVVSPVTAGLQFDFNPTGLSNDSNNRLWQDSNNANVSMSVSNNFDWNNGGYKTDENGNQYFCIKSGTTATFSYNLFEENAKEYGAEFKCVFKTTNVRRADATFLNCVADTTPVGLQMNVHEAYLKTSGGNLHIPYSENDIIEFEFNINAIGENDDAVIMSYEDGVALRPMLYLSSTRLHQYDPIPLTFGSPDCDVYIYRMKAYNTALSDANILNNFIADSRDATTMLARYNRNQIYNENSVLTPESVAHACPQLRVIKIDCPYFTNDKNNYVKGTNVQCIYEDGDPVLDNWQFNNCYHSGQGTSSNKYGISGRNIDIVMCADGKDQISSKINETAAAVDPNYITELILGDGTTYSYNGNLPYDEDTNNRDKVKVSLSRTSVPNNWFNIKVNIASSENANNALLQKRFNDFLPYTTIAMDNDPKCKNSMEFYNCVIFVRENNADLSTHREFNDTDWHFYAIGNIGDSKKTDATRVNNINDLKEFVVEFSDNTLPNTTFQTGVYWADAEKTQTTFDVTESVAGMKYPITKEEWENENNITRKCLYDNYSYMRLNDKNEEEEVFVTWDSSFEFRYDMGGDTKDGATIQTTDEQKAAQRLRNKQILRDFYEWVITCPDNRFATELEGWFIKDSALYWYLFTERYTMIDNRAKNTFYHFADIGSYHIVPYPNSLFMDMYYEKDGDEYTLTEDVAVDSNKTYYWRYAFEMWDYDNDTALGIDNNGDMVFPYGKEDTDILNGIAVFNAAGSVFWCRIRDLMYNDLATLYKRIDNESPNCWDSESLITQFDTWQEQFPEELWRLDIQRKYYRVYLAQSIDNSIIPIDKETGKIVKDSTYLTSKLNGRKRYHRRQFERSQATYIASKYKTESSETNTIWFRACQKDENSSIDANYSLSLTPYSDMYINIEVGNTSGDSTTFRRRALAGQTYTFIVPEILLSDGDAMVSIFYGNHIQAINDLSKFYMKGNNFSAGTRLQRLIIGNATEGYVNNNITSISLNSPLLEELDLRNCPNLNSITGLARCTSLKEFYADNTSITDASFAVNGKLETTHLPITVNTLSLRSLNNLTEFQFGYSDGENHYDNLEVLTVESTNIDALSIIEDSVDTLKNLTAIGINWVLNDKSLLDSIYSLTRSYLAGTIYIDDEIDDMQIFTYYDKWNDLTITSNESKRRYLVRYVNYDNSVIATTYVNHGDVAPDITQLNYDLESEEAYSYIDANGVKQPAISVPFKPGNTEYSFTFTGWSSNRTQPVTQSGVTIQAQYAQDKFAVNYYDYNEETGRYDRLITSAYVSSGSNPPDITQSSYVDANGVTQSAMAPPSGYPSDANYMYVFDYWVDANTDNGIEMVTINAPYNVKAKYKIGGKAIKYYNYNPETGENDTLIATAYVAYDDTIPDITADQWIDINGATQDPISAPQKPYDENYVYEFDYWTTNSVDATTITVSPTSNVNINAVYKIINCAVTYTNYDGTVLAKRYVPVSDGTNNYYPPNVITSTQYDLLEQGVIDTPRKPSDEDYVYTFDHWDDNTIAVTEPRTVVAAYSSETRLCTVNWFIDANHGKLATKTAAYRTDFRYEDATPSGAYETLQDLNTSEVFDTYYDNNIGKWRVFTGKWDICTDDVKLTVVGDSDVLNVHGIWEEVDLPSTDTDLKDMSLAEIAAIMANSDEVIDSYNFELKDYFDFNMGDDVDFIGIQSKTIIDDSKYTYIVSTKDTDGNDLTGDSDMTDESGETITWENVIAGNYEKLYNARGYEADITEDEQGNTVISFTVDTYFDGTVNSVIDTGIKLFDEDSPSFTLAIELEFKNVNSENATVADKSLVSCYSNDGSEGFNVKNYKYANANTTKYFPNIQWGDKYRCVESISDDFRKTLVLRHTAGSDDLYVYDEYNRAPYQSFEDYTNTLYETKLTRTRSTLTNATLVFGGTKNTDGSYTNYGTGTIHWAKIWYEDIGVNAAKELQKWFHHKIRMELYGHNAYNLSNSELNCSLSFISNNVLPKYYGMSAADYLGLMDSQTPVTSLSVCYENIPYILKRVIKPVQLNQSHITSVKATVSDPTDTSYDTYSDSPVFVSYDSDNSYWKTYNHKQTITKSSTATSNNSNISPIINYYVYPPAIIEIVQNANYATNSNIPLEGDNWLIDDINQDKYINRIIGEGSIDSNILRLKYYDIIPDTVKYYFSSTQPINCDIGSIWINSDDSTIKIFTKYKTWENPLNYYTRTPTYMQNKCTKKRNWEYSKQHGGYDSVTFAYPQGYQATSVSISYSNYYYFAKITQNGTVDYTSQYGSGGAFPLCFSF